MLLHVIGTRAFVARLFRRRAAIAPVLLALVATGCSGVASDRSFQLDYTISQADVEPGATYTAAFDISDGPVGDVIQGVEILVSEGVEVTDVALASISMGGHVAGLFIDMDEALDYTHTEIHPVSGTVWTEEIASSRPAVYVEMRYVGPGPAAVLKVTALFGDGEGRPKDLAWTNQARCLTDGAQDDVEDVLVGGLAVDGICMAAAERELRIWESHPRS